MCIKSNFVQEEVAELRTEVGELQTQLLRHQVVPRTSNHCLKLDLDSDSYSDIFSSIWEAMVILKLNLILILDPASPLN